MMAAHCYGAHVGCMKEEQGSPLQRHPMRLGKIPSPKWTIDTVTETQKGLSEAYT